MKARQKSPGIQQTSPDPPPAPRSPLWQARCRNCDWTSGTRDRQDEADALGKFHAQDTGGHTVTLKEVGGAGGPSDRHTSTDRPC